MPLLVFFNERKVKKQFMDNAATKPHVRYDKKYRIAGA